MVKVGKSAFWGGDRGCLAGVFGGSLVAGENRLSLARGLGVVAGMADEAARIELIIPNLKKRFSGITSTMIQVLPRQKDRISIATVGHPLGVKGIPHVGWREIFRQSGKLLPDGSRVIWHARRNDDMIVGVMLKYVFRRKLRLIFTSVAQRKHSALTRFLYGRMDTLLSTSDRSASYLLRKPDRIIPHGVDLETYFPAADREALWAESGLPGRYGIGIFGRVRPQKGLREFVEALCRVLPQHPEYTAVICGETTPEFRAFVEELKGQIAEAGLSERFVWLGKRPFEEIPIWFRRMSLVAAVSHTEGFGLTCLEAMASGAPVVGSQTGGFEMVIRPGVDGEIVPCRDALALGAVFEALLANRAELVERGRAARKRVETSFSIEKEALALLEVYRG